jgi:hypothetical protein
MPIDTNTAQTGAAQALDDTRNAAAAIAQADAQAANVAKVAKSASASANPALSAALRDAQRNMVLTRAVYHKHAQVAAMLKVIADAAAAADAARARGDATVAAQQDAIAAKMSNAVAALKPARIRFPSAPTNTGIAPPKRTRGLPSLPRGLNVPSPVVDFAPGQVVQSNQLNGMRGLSRVQSRTVNGLGDGDPFDPNSSMFNTDVSNTPPDQIDVGEADPTAGGAVNDILTKLGGSTNTYVSSNAGAISSQTSSAIGSSSGGSDWSNVLTSLFNSASKVIGAVAGPPNSGIVPNDPTKRLASSGVGRFFAKNQTAILGGIGFLTLAGIGYVLMNRSEHAASHAPAAA